MKRRNKIWFLAVILVIVTMLVGLSTGCRAKIVPVAETSAEDASEAKENKTVVMSGEELGEIIKKSMQLGAELAIAEANAETSTEVTSEAAATTTEEKAVSETIVEGEIPAFYESEGGIPYNGTEWNVDVAPDEIEVFTCGPAEINGVVLKGGSNPDRGSVIVLLPDPKNEKVINYTIKKVIAGSNWHGAIDFGRVPTEKDWKMLVDDRVKAMMETPNGTSGKGCQIVNVVVVQGDNVIYQKTFEK